MKPRRDGFTLVEIMIVVSILGMLVVMASPSFVRNRSLTQNAICINNLRMLVTAKSLFALEERRAEGDPVVDADVNPYLKKPMDRMPEPSGGNYDLRPVGHDPLCSVGHVY